MRTLTAALSAVALTIGVAAPAMAHPLSEVLPPLTVDLTHQATDNVGFVARFPEHAGSAGGALTSNEAVEDLFVITDPRGVHTYDVSDPRSPVNLGFVPVAQGAVAGTGALGAALGQEDPPTDGNIILVDGRNTDDVFGLQVVSVADPANPTVLSTVEGVTSHTWTCITDVESGNGCGFAYGRGASSTDQSSQIVDLRDPSNPVLLDQGWREAVGSGGLYVHDLTEIRPGLVMSAGSKPALMDTTDPANPILLVRIDEGDHERPGEPIREFPSLGYHSVEWAQSGTDDFLIMGTEIAPSGTTNTAGSDCEGENSVIETWDARTVVTALADYDALVADGATRAAAADTVFGVDRDDVNFRLLDAYDATGQGLFVDGQAPAHVLYCAHWMEFNPSWQDGGRLVVGYYNRGIRFVDVTPFSEGEDAGGTMEEHGWFVGADAYTGSAQWVGDDVVYVSDYARGLDIIELVDTEATGTYTADSRLGENAMTIAELEAAGIAAPAEDGAPYALLVAAGLGLAALGALRRRRTTATA